MSDTDVAPAPQDEANPAEPVNPPAEGTGDTQPAAEPSNALDRALDEPAEPVVTPATYPEDWRQQMAGEDDKLAKQLERFDSPAALAKSYKELQRRVSSGEFKRSKPEGEEDLAAWRDEVGIPAEPSGYDLNDLGNGLVVGEADQPLIDKVLTAMHGVDSTQDQVKAIVAAYYEAQEGALADEAEQDRMDAEGAVDALRAEWGPEYRGNMNQLKGFLDAAPGDVGTLVTGARLGDGKALLNSPDAMQWLLGVAKQLNPMGSVVPAAGDAGKTVADELKEIGRVQEEEPKKYWADKDMQARERELLAWQDRQR